MILLIIEEYMQQIDSENEIIVDIRQTLKEITWFFGVALIIRPLAKVTYCFV